MITVEQFLIELMNHGYSINIRTHVSTTEAGWGPQKFSWIMVSCLSGYESMKSAKRFDTPEEVLADLRVALETMIKNKKS